MGESAIRTIDKNLPTPLYHQIYLVIRGRITSGEYPHGSTLPGEQALARMFGVSRITVKRALSELASEGYISRHRGRGTMVKFRMRSPVVRANFDSLLENLLMMGLKTDVKLLKLERTEATGRIAAALELEEGTPVQHVVRARSLEGEPFSYIITHIPLDLATGFTRREMGSRPVLSLLEKAGVQVASAEQSITAAAADPETAQALDVAIGAPLTKIIRVVRDRGNRPVQHIVVYYRPEKYHYEMKLTRVAAEGAKIWNTSD